MSGSQILFEQILKALQEDDTLTINILLEDQDLGEIEKMSVRIQNQVLRQKYVKLIKAWIEKNEKIEGSKCDDQKLRQIYSNRKNDNSQGQDAIEKQTKKKKNIKFEEVFNYQFYSNVKCLMIAYGDLKPKQQSIKMMHSQVQILFQTVFKFIEEIEQEQSRERLAFDESKSLKARSKTPEETIKKYLYQIFKEEACSYEEISRQYKKATKSAKNKQYQQSEQELQLQSSSESENQDESKRIASKHMSINNFQESEYFAKLTKQMSIKQYEDYSQCRAINFIHNGHNSSRKNQQATTQFVKYIDPNMNILKNSMKIFDLLSFLCCRIVRKIMFTIIRNRHEGKLEPISEITRSGENKTSAEPQSITEQQIRNTGNDLIEDYQKNFVTIKEANQSIKQIAKKCFIDDFHNHNFKTLLPKRYLPLDAELIWQQSKHYQQMWVNRILGQKEVEKQLTCQGSNHVQGQSNGPERDKDTKNEENMVELFEPVSQYGKYIVKNLQYYRRKGSTSLWKKYFSQEKVQKSKQREDQREKDYLSENMNKPKKKVKLESLKN